MIWLLACSVTPEPATRATYFVTLPSPSLNAEAVAQTRQLLLGSPCITEVELVAPREELTVTVNPEHLPARDLTFSDVRSELGAEPWDKAVVKGFPLVDFAEFERSWTGGARLDGTPAAALDITAEGCDLREELTADVLYPAENDVRVELPRAQEQDVLELEQVATTLGAEHVSVRWYGEQARVVAHGAEDPDRMRRALQQTAYGHPGSDAVVRARGEVWHEVVITGPPEALIEVESQVVAALEVVPGLDELQRQRPPMRRVVEVTVDAERAAMFGVTPAQVAASWSDFGSDQGTVGLDGGWENATIRTSGGVVPLTAMADVTVGSEPVWLRQVDGQPAIAVYVMGDQRALDAALPGIELPAGVRVYSR